MTHSSTHLAHSRNERIRQKMLQHLDILDTRREEAFDAVARRVGDTLNAPIALISFVDGKRLWFKSRIGLEIESIPRHCSPCSYTILNAKVFIVRDTAHDVRFKDCALISTPPYARFYAGSPIIVPDGLLIGVVCVLDTKPRRSISALDKQGLKEAAASVGALILQKAGLYVPATN